MTEDARVRFEPTYNFGHILTVVAMIGSVAAAGFGIGAKLVNHDDRLLMLESKTSSIERAEDQATAKLSEISDRLSRIEGALGVPHDPGKR